MMKNLFRLIPLVFFTVLDIGFAGGAPLPNIVILYADDMGVADVSYGDPDAKIQTPNLDRLAAQGMTFTDGHSSSGICTPSRFALLTGQHHWRRFHGIVGAFGGTVFKDGEYTVPGMLREEGYRTGCFGKWHLGWNFDAIRKPGEKRGAKKAEAYDWTKPFPGGPLERGFEVYFGDGTINFPPYCWIENDRFLTIPTKPVMKSEPLAGGGSFRPGPMAEDWNPFDVLPTITEKTVEWISTQNKHEPFFVYHAFNSPHYPIVPNEAFHGKSNAGFYGDFVIETDAMVGKVMDALEAGGFADKTLVIFTADNGPETHAFNRLQEFEQWSSGAYRGVKRDIYEGGHRVPFIVRWPGQIEAGTVSEEVVSQVDLAATFAAITGHKLENDQAIDSYNLLPVLKGMDYSHPLRKATVHNTSANKFALRQGDWVLIDAGSGAAKKEGAEYLAHFDLDAYGKGHDGLLFNLKDDPRQSKNVYADYPKKVKQMRDLLNRYRDGEPCAPRREYSSNLSTDRLVPWCIVPFDASKRSPAERAEMLQRLGFTRCAYDWRKEHVAEFETEILEYKKRGIEMFAFWRGHEAAFELFEKHEITPQVWQFAPSPKAETDADRVAAAVATLRPMAERTKALRCSFGLYNHGGWGGEAPNLVAVCLALREAGFEHTGIVYNWHHGHGRIDQWEADLRLMKPYLYCLNVNGMNSGADPKILPLGKGEHDKEMFEVLRRVGYDGPVGILDHQHSVDSEVALRENLAGLRKLQEAEE